MTPVPGPSKIKNFCKRVFVLLLIGWLLSFGIAFANTMDNGWVVQLGSFKEQKNAQDFISKIKKKGYTPFIVRGEESDWYKTRVGPYPSKEEADQVVLDLKKAQGITAIVLVSNEKPPDLEETIDSVDVVVSQFLIWLKAWEAQKINSYLSFYSKDFKDSKRPRESWEAQRRKTFGSSSGVSIEVSDIQILRADDAVEMSFIQDYKSDRISDVGKKILIWKNEGDRWKIVKESWESS
jgi:hypothetical protein